MSRVQLVKVMLVAFLIGAAAAVPFAALLRLGA